MRKNQYEITGMTCSACSARVEKTVSQLQGVSQVTVNLLTNSMKVEYDERELDSGKIIDAVTRIGYGAAQKGGGLQGKAVQMGASSGKLAENAKAEYQNQTEKTMAGMKKRVWISVLFLVPLMYLAMHHMLKEWFGIPVPSVIKDNFHGTKNAVLFSFTQFLLLIPILVVNVSYFKIGFKTLLQKSPNMDSLIAVGSSAAVLFGVFAIYRIGYGLGYSDFTLVDHYLENLYFESAGTILTLVTVGKYLETKSKGKTSLAITKLIDMAPKTAWKEENGQVIEIPVEDLKKDDLFQIKPGGSFPVDGIIIEGKTLVDESAITGESIPVLKNVGDKIVSGTLNQTGFLRCKAERVGEDTTLSRIIALVEEASSSKAPIAKLADKIAGVFVPIVMVLSLITFVAWMVAGKGFEFALVSAIAVLVISCPCALGLATPVAIMVGTGKGAGLGILIKSGEALQNVSNIEIAVFDKTGTLTQGKPKVTDEYFPLGMTQTEFYSIAAGMESASEHPLADAVIAEAKRLAIQPMSVSEFVAVPGKGMKADIEQYQYLAGNEALMQEYKVELPFEVINKINQYAEEGKTPLLFAKLYPSEDASVQEKRLAQENQEPQEIEQKGEIFGILAVADTVKETSEQAIVEFKKLGIRTIMLTGDNAITAKAIQRKLQLDEVIAEVLPDQKEEQIRLLQKMGKKVLMIGDGINDAPALMRADVGVAVGAGSDIAIESADIILMHDDIMDAVTMVRLGKAVIRNIKENLFWAFSYNIIGIPLAAGLFYPLFGWQLSPMFGAAAMSFSSIFVVSNALRLRFFKAETTKKKNNNEDNEYNEENEMKRQGFIETIQQPDLQATNNRRWELTMNQQETILKIEGMMCEHCVKSVTKALTKIQGVDSVQVDLTQKTATVLANPDVPLSTLNQAVEDAGYTIIQPK